MFIDWNMCSEKSYNRKDERGGYLYIWYQIKIDRGLSDKLFNIVRNLLNIKLKLTEVEQC